MQARTDVRIIREELEMTAGIETPEIAGPGGRHVDEQYADRYIAAHDSRSHGETSSMSSRAACIRAGSTCSASPRRRSHR